MASQDFVLPSFTIKVWRKVSEIQYHNIINMAYNGCGYISHVALVPQDLYFEFLVLDLVAKVKPNVLKYCLPCSLDDRVKAISEARHELAIP